MRRSSPGPALALLSKAWCCGTLQTGVIAVAFTNMVSITLLSLWIMQVLAKGRHAFIAVIVACLIVFVLLVSNVCLIYGAMTKKRHMVAPWLTLYVFAVIGIVVALALNFDAEDFAELRVVSVVAIAFLIYCYLIVASFHAELKFADNDEKAAAATGISAAPNKQIANGGDHCLIALGDDDVIVAGEQDDTFSDLALRVNLSKLDSSAGSTLIASQQQSVLPQPDEVIAIPERLQSTTETTNNRQGGDATEIPTGEEGEALLPGDDDVVDAASRSLSSKTLPLFADSSQISSSSGAGSRRYKPAANKSAVTSTTSVSSSSAKNLLRHSNSALVRDIDSSFTPHKSGSASALSADLPKMRIFLPKSNDDDDSSDSSSDGGFDGGDTAAAVQGDGRAVNTSA